MKYSIRGNSSITDGTPFVDAVNNYPLWRLITGSGTDEAGQARFSFEAWVNTIADKDALWSDLKPLIDAHGGSIDWHECTHDEPDPRPCVIAETYPIGG